MAVPLCYLNGDFLPLAEARVSPLDRAFLFGDAVYEVIPVYAGRPFRLREHLDRLGRSLQGIRMDPPLTHTGWAEVLERLVERNGGGDKILYLQVSRGAEAARNHVWSAGLRPTVFAYVSALDALPERMLDAGVAAITATDTRWARRDIKSTALLANVLLTEGSSTTVHVIAQGVLHTPPNGPHILPGTTRDVVAELAARLGLEFLSTPVTAARLRSADEIWLAFSTRGLLPVTTLDAAPVGDGRPGRYFRRMHAAFLDYVHELAGTPLL